MTTKFLLNQNSSNEDLKKYFTKIFALEKSGEEFPVDLDEVWMLVYGRKDNAIAALKENFIQHIDYQFFLQNQENSRRGRPTKKYKLSVSCLEYFIARKVRPVFQVYRNVTHAYQKELTEKAESSFHVDEMLETIEMQVKLMRKHHERIGRLEDQVTLFNAKSKTRTDQFTIAGFASLIGKKIGRQLASKIGKKATAICNRKGYPIERVYDPRFGKVNVYPKEVLHSIFEEIFEEDISIPVEL